MQQPSPSPQVADIKMFGQALQGPEPSQSHINIVPAILTGQETCLCMYACALNIPSENIRLGALRRSAVDNGLKKYDE